MPFLIAIIYIYICFTLGSLLAAKLKGIKLTYEKNILIILTIPYIIFLINKTFVEETWKLSIREGKEISKFKSLEIFLKLSFIFTPFVYDLVYFFVLEMQRKNSFAKEFKKEKSTIISKTYPKYRTKVMQYNMNGLTT